VEPGVDRRGPGAMDGWFVWGRLLTNAPV